jgi:Zn-dependent protease
MLLLSAIISINIGLGVFNLIPLPPLDGSKIITPFLPENAKQWFVNNEQLFYIIFMLIWITGIAGSIISPIIGVIYKAVIGFGKFVFML